MNIIKTIKHNPFILLRDKNFQKNILNSFYYFGGTLIQFIISLFTQPIFSKHLELNDFAVMGYFVAIQNILFPLFNMSLPFYFLSRYWVNDKNLSPEKNLSFILNFLNISNGVMAIVSFLLISSYFKMFNVIFPLAPFIFIVITTLIFEKFKTYYLIECRIQKKGLNFFLLNLLQIFLNIGFSLYFVVTLKYGAAGRMSGSLIGVIAVSIVALIILIRTKKYLFSLKIDKKQLRTAMTYSFPLIISSYAYYPIENADRLFLERLGTTAELGYYNIGLTIAAFVEAFFLALYQSFEPDLYKFIANKNYKNYILFIFIYLLILAIFSITFILFSSFIVGYLTSGRFTYASGYANIFIIAIFLMHIGSIFEQLFTAYGATKLVMIRNILMGLFCIISYYFMISHYQFKGANINRIFVALFYIISGAVLFFIYTRKKSNETN